jgi:energy-coupling factor transporter ATP-binding protein EcfA2
MNISICNFKVLKGLKVSIPNKGLVLLQGASGSGKSTLIDAILFAVHKIDESKLEKGCNTIVEIFTKFNLCRSLQPNMLKVENNKMVYFANDAKTFVDSNFFVGCITQQGEDLFLSKSLDYRLQCIEDIAGFKIECTKNLEYEIGEAKIAADKQVHQIGESVNVFKSMLQTMDKGRDVKMDESDLKILAIDRRKLEVEMSHADLYNGKKRLENQINQLEDVLKGADDRYNKYSQLKALKVKNDIAREILKLQVVEVPEKIGEPEEAANEVVGGKRTYDEAFEDAEKKLYHKVYFLNIKKNAMNCVLEREFDENEYKLLFAQVEKDLANKYNFDICKKALMYFPRFEYPYREKSKIQEELTRVIREDQEMLDLYKQKHTFLEYKKFQAMLEEVSILYNKAIEDQVRASAMFACYFRSKREQINRNIFILEGRVNALLKQMFFKPMNVHIKDDCNIDVFYNDRQMTMDDLSGGEKSRLAIAFTCAICELKCAKMLLLDESLSNLDSYALQLVIYFLKIWAEERSCCVIVVSHSSINGWFDHLISI